MVVSEERRRDNGVRKEAKGGGITKKRRVDDVCEREGWKEIRGWLESWETVAGARGLWMRGGDGVAGARGW